MADPHPFDLEIRSADRGTTRTITPVGEIDLGSVAGLGATLATTLADRPETLVLDLGEVTFADSTAVHLLLDTQRRATAAGIRLVVLAASEAVRELFSLCGLADRLAFVPRGVVQEG